jgi:FkbM family methyltransferase
MQSLLLPRLADYAHLPTTWDHGGSARTVYRNWLVWPLPKLGISTILELKTGIRFLVRGGTGDLAVINESAMLNPYLASGYVRLLEDAIIIDGGANIGDFAAIVASRCPRGRIYAIEPIDENARMIEINRALNGLNNVEIAVTALGATNGHLAIRSDGMQSSFHYGKTNSYAMVPVTTLEAFMDERGLNRVDLLKLDCEGAEWEVISTSTAILPRISQICLEYHRRDEWTVEKLADLLRDAGYDVHHTAGEWNGVLWAVRTDPSRSAAATASPR